MRKGFSLIEIIQTVILLGIIAGLSISFFKNNSNEIKLYEETVKLLRQAEIEAQRAMCSDATPTCQGIGDTIATTDINNDPCEHVSANIAGNIVYTSDGYCRTPITEADISTTALIAGIDYVLIKNENNSNDTANYVAYPPLCPIINNGYTEANLMSDIICPNGIANYEAIRRDPENLANALDGTEICRQLHSIINHKRQGTTDILDYAATCTTPVHECIVIGGDCKNVSDDADDNHVNMILPNGARIYGLSRAFTNASPGTLTVFIKYDRLANVNSVTITNTDHNTTPDRDGLFNTRPYVFTNPTQ